MKIIGLEIDGYRKLTAIEMEFKSKGLTVIKGDNEQGKTSVLDSIEYLFRGKSKLNGDVIQHGKDELKGKLYLTGYTVERVQYRDGKNRLEIKTDDGLNIGGKKQAFLNSLINDLTFDPEQFTKLKTSNEKMKFVTDLFGMNFEKINKQLEDFEYERTLKFREIDKFETPKEVEKVFEIDIEKLRGKKLDILKNNEELKMEFESRKEEKLEEIIQKNNKIREKNEKIKIMKKDIDFLKSNKSTIENQILELQKELKIKSEKIDKIEMIFKKINKPEKELSLKVEIVGPTYESVEDIENEIEEAYESNEKHKQYLDYKKAVKRKGKLQEEYENFTSEIKDLRDKKEKKLREIKIGLDNFEVRSGGLYYKNIFSENWSDSQEIRVAAALCKAANPELKAVLVNNGSEFGHKKFKELEKWSIENDIQCIIAIVESKKPSKHEKNVYYIEEGEIKK